MLVSKFSNVLKDAGVKVGEPVVIYLPCSIIAVAAMQGKIANMRLSLKYQVTKF